MPLQAPEVGPALADVNLLVERVLAEGVGAAGEDVEDDRARRVDVAGEVRLRGGRAASPVCCNDTSALIYHARVCERECAAKGGSAGVCGRTSKGSAAPALPPLSHSISSGLIQPCAVGHRRGSLLADADAVYSPTEC